MSFSSPFHSQPFSLLVQSMWSSLISWSIALLSNVLNALLPNALNSSRQIGAALVVAAFWHCQDKTYRIHVHNTHLYKDLYWKGNIFYKYGSHVAYQPNHNHICRM